MHEFSKWFLRLMIVAGVIGFSGLFLYRNLGSLIETATAPPAATAAAPASAELGDRFPPCQPIGRTARGELVFSMDCQRAAPAAEAADGDGK
ncbi:hypothetical protein HNR60_003747 [Rhodopseudomonas rhenobacensis]|uniref:Uncharacterized protein n=1 Tax=Rhodopseudomonas rhenobacensis TaxID=87461 RepID=A0A7W7Z6N1_9BRAD|nr:hypothetical protein [Rhodopseudomonas rhenobacensis]MBB5048976.1 hypothetical protein [Rhodopseudomonas rhenobacensis]